MSPNGPIPAQSDFSQSPFLQQLPLILNRLAYLEGGPEKAGVGGSIPSLATTIRENLAATRSSSIWFKTRIGHILDMTWELSAPRGQARCPIFFCATSISSLLIAVPSCSSALVRRFLSSRCALDRSFHRSCNDPGCLSCRKAQEVIAA